MHHWLIRALGVSVFGFVAMVGCIQFVAGDPTADFVSQSGWHVVGESPIIQAGDFRSKGLWNDPSVIETDDGFAMYLTTSVDEPFRPPILPFRLVSYDGVHWKLSSPKPLVSVEDTPFVSAETPSVIEYQNEFHMYFTGIYPDGVDPPMALGHAVSKDGIAWTVDSKPLLTATGNFSDWNGYLVGEPGAIVVGDSVYVYFSAVGARAGGNPPQDQSIGLITSTNGRTFTSPKRVLRQSEAYPASQGFVGYSTPAAFELDGKIHLVYSVAHYSAARDPQWQQVAIHHAWSDDGQTKFMQDDAPILTTKDLSWTNGEILGPSVIVAGDEVRMWFSGHVRRSELGPMIVRGFKGREFGIGLATATRDVVTR